MADLLARVKPNQVGSLTDPVNIAILDVDGFIHNTHALQVKSSLTLEPSTNLFHSEGLYSESIFGPIGSPQRMERFGYVDLHTRIFHPKIYQLIVQLGGLYGDIMKGSAYAVFNPVTKDFDRVYGDRPNVPEAGTGFSFFLQHFAELTFKRSASAQRDERIEVIEQYKELSVFTRYLVEPAGLRDISNDSSGRLVQDEINKLYGSLLLYTRSIPSGAQSPLYDPVRFQIQAKAVEIYEYIENFLDGKRGFVQGSFARRKVAMGTRNVITASTFMAAHPEDPQLQKADDVMVGVYQTCKGLQPFFKNALNTIFIHPIFKTEATTQVALSDPRTGKLVYTSVTPATRDSWTSSDGQDRLVNSFRNTSLRQKPVMIRDAEKKEYALLMVYDDGDHIALCRSIDDLEASWPRKVDKTKLRPITYIEMFYLIAETISAGKHGIVTRYPVIEQGSSYVARIHVVSTTPGRIVQMVDLLSPDHVGLELRQYPVIGAASMDAMMAHPSKLGGLGADHDGDKCSLEYIWSRDANEECANYLSSKRSVIGTDLRFISGSTDYLTETFLHCLTYR